MVEHDVLNPHSEVELEKAIKLELIWLIGEEAEKATLLILQEHIHKLKGLHAHLQVEQLINRKPRVEHKLSRSWHK